MIRLRSGALLDAEQLPDLLAGAFGNHRVAESGKFGASYGERCITPALLCTCRPTLRSMNRSKFLCHRASGPLSLYAWYLVSTARTCAIVERLEGGDTPSSAARAKSLPAKTRTSPLRRQDLHRDARAVFSPAAAKPGKEDRTSTWSSRRSRRRLAAVVSIAVSHRAPGVRGEINALFFPGGQHVDLDQHDRTHTPGTRSQTLVKSAANDRGQARYLGNIRIAPHAQGTDACLRDDALLLLSAKRTSIQYRRWKSPPTT